MSGKIKGPVCGAEFVPRTGRGRPQKFCSAKCAVQHHNALAKAQRPTYTKTCAICGAEFETRMPNVCCRSPECSRAYKAEWRRLRRKGEVTVKKPQSDAQKDRVRFIDSTYVAIKRKRRARPAVVGGWRGTPCMGGGGSSASQLFVPSLQL